MSAMKKESRIPELTPDTRARLDAIPVPTADMTTDELRQICLDFMDVQTSFVWTPNSSFIYLQWQGKEPEINEGTIYGGMPYVSCTMSSLYRALYFYDEETGVLDTATLGDNFAAIMGNQCSGNSAWGWARVCSAATWNSTQYINPAHNAILVGPYTYDTEKLTDFYTQKIHTREDICEKNGEQVMYESYALLEKADGIVDYKRTGGHVRMVRERPVVVRNEDGTINGEESYLDCREQGSARVERTMPDGQTIYVMDADRRYTFYKLFRGGYLPFTMPEFHGLKKIEPARVSLTHTKGTVTYDELMESTVECNYAISDIEITIKNKDGKKLYYGFIYPERTAFETKEFQLKIAKRGTPPFTGYAGGGNTITLRARVGTGQLLPLYEGEYCIDEGKADDITRLVAEPLTWNKLRQIPVAKADMTEEEIREICRRLMEVQLSFTWTPNETFTIPRKDGPLALERGTVYGGCPYVACTWNSIYHAMEYYDEETGVMNSAAYGEDFKTLFGNQCAGSAFWGWARACNSIRWGGTSEMTVKNGCLRVGPYTYDDNLESFYERDTHEIIADNGEQTIFESYAATKVADGIVCFKGKAGHVRMVSQPVTVVRNADGTVDGDKSCMAFQHQHPTHKPFPQKNGATFMRQGGVNTVRSFNELLKDGYIPFTLAELCGKKEVEKAWAKVDYEGEEIEVERLDTLTVTSNYPIVKITLTVNNQAFNRWRPLYFKKILTDLSKFCHYDYKTESFGASPKLQELRKMETLVVLRALVSTGETIEMYRGNLK